MQVQGLLRRARLSRHSPDRIITITGAGGFFPAGGGVFYGLSPDAVDEPVAVAPPLKQSDDLRYTCVYDIPWDYVHRCPQFR